MSDLRRAVVTGRTVPSEAGELAPLTIVPFGRNTRSLDEAQSSAIRIEDVNSWRSRVNCKKIKILA